MSYIIPICYLEFAISACYFHLLSLIYIEVWSVEAFRKTSEREGEETAWRKSQWFFIMLSL